MFYIATRVGLKEWEMDIEDKGKNAYKGNN